MLQQTTASSALSFKEFPQKFRVEWHYLVKDQKGLIFLCIIILLLLYSYPNKKVYIEGKKYLHGSYLISPFEDSLIDPSIR